MEKPCISVVPMGNALLMVSAGDRAKGAIVRLGLDEDGATDGATIVEWAVDMLPFDCKFHNSMGKACISVVPVHGDSPICAAHREASAIVIGFVEDELRSSSSWSIVVTCRSPCCCLP